jgi:hypothetical protein
MHTTGKILGEGQIYLNTLTKCAQTGTAINICALMKRDAKTWRTVIFAMDGKNSSTIHYAIKLILVVAPFIIRSTAQITIASKKNEANFRIP